MKHDCIVRSMQKKCDGGETGNSSLVVPIVVTDLIFERIVVWKQQLMLLPELLQATAIF